MKQTLLLLGFSLLFPLSKAHAQTDGSLDMSFAPVGTSAVRAIKQLADGRVVIAHSSFISGGIKMYNSDGSPSNVQFSGLPSQTEFNGNWIREIHQQTDGKIICINSAGQPRVYRYNLDGSKDTAYQNAIGTGANLTIRKGLLDNLNRLLLIGDFTDFNGVPKTGIVRLNQNGTIDPTFTTNCGNCILKDVCFNEYGGYFLGGLVNLINGQATYNKTVKLTETGAIDTSFRTNLGMLDALAMQPDGHLVGITGAEAGSGAPKRVVQFSLDGQQDNTLGSYGGNNVVEIYAQQDGKLIFTGGFNSYFPYNATNSVSVNRIFRVLPNGDLDPSFNIGSGPDYDISCSDFSSTGSILLGGSFGQFNGQPRTNMARLINSGTPFTILSAQTSAGHASNDFSVFPNPIANELHWQANVKVEMVELRDLSGRLLTAVKDPLENTLRLGFLSPGVYVLSLVDYTGTRTSKRIIKTE